MENRAQESERRLEAARARLRFAVEDARGEVRRHAGLRLGRSWVLPIVAAAAGVTTAWALRRRRRRLDE